MDPHALRILEFHRVLDLLAAHASTTAGADLCRALEPLPHPETVVARLDETREARAILDRDGALPFGGITDIRDAAARAERDARLTPLDLVGIARTLEAARGLRTFLANRRDVAPRLAATAVTMQPPAHLEQRILAAIDDAGEVRDSASPLLSRLRSEIRATSNRIQDRLAAILAGDAARAQIQEALVTLREGRYCIPVKAEYARAFGGIVHDTSGSGATVFIEPAQTAALGNELKQLALREEAEVDRILGELSHEAAVNAAAIVTVIQVLAHLDCAQARASLAEEQDAIEPELNRRGIVRLVEARHPLLTGSVVPISVTLGDRYAVLLITGPNTGGKTVALKTLGLLTLMALAGMQIPASHGSEIALFDQVFADIGDEQDIRMNLSTFSAHVRNLIAIVRECGPNALVLMDEVGAGTDPAEGAALAKALIDHLMQRGARIAATTHYGELKEYAYTREGVENASVEFDEETLAPTYRLLVGIPGSSNALSIARRLGLAPEIVDDAAGFLSHREVETGELVRRIERSRRAAEAAESDALRAREAALEAEEAATRKLEEAARIERAVRQNAEAEARTVLRRMEERCDNIVAELARAHAGSRKATAARRRLAETRTETLAALETAPEPRSAEAQVPAVMPQRGDPVRVLSLGLDGEVLELAGDDGVTVQVGSIRARFPASDLRVIRTPAASGRPAAATSAATALATRKAMQISPELMLRGMRADEAIALLDKYLDDGLAAGLATVRIVHGKGTGALRRVVSEYLATSPSVRDFRLAEDHDGGDGVTVVTLNT